MYPYKHIHVYFSVYTDKQVDILETANVNVGFDQMDVKSAFFGHFGAAETNCKPKMITC